LSKIYNKNNKKLDIIRLFRNLGVFMKQNEIKELIKIFDESDITKLKIEDKDFSISLSKEATAVAQAPVAPAPAPVSTPSPVATQPSTPTTTTESKAPAGLTINSPMVGTFYKAPSPGAPAFVKVGDSVNAGQTVGIIEAMKIMNEIEAEFDCKILEILVEDGQPVEFDTPLFVVEKR
jgi:acetyl-CoA carboxylase biotin carboxyl carrier protein